MDIWVTKALLSAETSLAFLFCPLASTRPAQLSPTGGVSAFQTLLERLLCMQMPGDQQLLRYSNQHQQTCHCHSHLDDIFPYSDVMLKFLAWCYSLCCCYMSVWLDKCTNVQVTPLQTPFLRGRWGDLYMKNKFIKYECERKKKQQIQKL